MRWLNILITRLRALLWRDKVIHDIDEELRAHLEMETEANREMGMAPEEARLSAAKSFGNVGSTLTSRQKPKNDFSHNQWREHLAFVRPFR